MKIEKLQTAGSYPTDWDSYDFFKYTRDKLNEIIDYLAEQQRLESPAHVWQLMRQVHALDRRIDKIQDELHEKKEKKAPTDLKLKECSKCSGNAEICFVSDRYFVRCRNAFGTCKFILRTNVYDTADEAIEAWNESLSEVKNNIPSLLYCPQCGSIPKIVDEGTTYFVTCDKNCRHRFRTKSCYTELEALKIWNEWI